MDGFFSRSSMPGVNYLSKTEPAVIRIIWILVISFGYTCLFIFFGEALYTWETKPDITTMESMTRPVEELYFPSVVACPGRDTPVDSMAPIASFLAPIEFQCETSMKPQADKNDQCKLRIDKIRKDFPSLFNFAIQKLDQLSTKLFNESDSMRMPTFIQRQIHDAANYFELLFRTNLTTPRELKRDIKSNFGFARSKLFLQKLNKKFNLTLSRQNESPRTAALKLATLMAVTLKELGNFGSFVTELLPVQMPRYFSSKAPRKKIAGSKLCNDIDTFYYAKGYHALNSLFSKLTKAIHDVASPTQPSIHLRKKWPSLYEVVNLVSYHPTQSMFRPFLSNWFLNSACQFFNESNWESLNEGSYCVQSHESQLYRNKGDPCSRIGSVCCSLNVAFELRDLRSIMSIMRLARHRGQGQMNDASILDVSAKLGYHMLDAKEILAYSSVYRPNTAKHRDPYAMIPTCEYIEQSNRGTKSGARLYKLCTLFQPIVTDQGMCQGFNSPSINDLLKPSYFLSAMNYAYKHDIRNTSVLFRATRFSAETGLNFILDRQTLFRRFWQDAPKISKGSFHISVSPQFSVMGIQTKQRVIQLGMHTQLLLTPVVLESNELRDLSIEKRKCLFSDEAASLVYFKNYSQAACQYECLVLHARSTCHCTPWDFPFENGRNISICNVYGYYCFEELLKNTTYMNQECECLPDCNVNEYHIEQTSHPIDVVKECENYERGFKITKGKSVHRRSDFSVTLDGLMHGSKFGFDHFGMHLNYGQLRKDCHTMLSSDVAYVSVKMSGAVYTKNVRTIRMNFVDKLASFGGTMGLFTGTSFVGLVELIYWLGLHLFRFLRCK